MERRFKIGDPIIMNKGANRRYSITLEGSEGIIEGLGYDSSYYEVSFSKLTGDASYDGSPFITSIFADAMDLHPIVNTPLYRALL